MEVNKLKNLLDNWEETSIRYDHDIGQSVTEKTVLFKQITRWLTAYLQYLNTKKEGIPKNTKQIYTEWQNKKPPINNQKNYDEQLQYLDNSMTTFTTIAFTLGIIKFHKEGQYQEIMDESEEAIIGYKKLKEK